MLSETTTKEGDYLNSNGLVDGKIPKGQACPCIDLCGRQMPTCPTERNPTVVDFSCALARLWSICKESERKNHIN